MPTRARPIRLLVRAALVAAGLLVPAAAGATPSVPDRAAGERPATERPATERPATERPAADRPAVAIAAETGAGPEGGTA